MSESFSPGTEESGRLTDIHISGYRPFGDFHASLGDLTVIIGANAAGKSSLFDFLRFIAFAAGNPLPPEIDPSSEGRTIFHLGGKELLSFALSVDFGEVRPLRYSAEIRGPLGSPHVTRERLETQPLQNEQSPFLFLDFREGQGVVADPKQRKLKRPAWIVEPNQLALRRALDPTLFTLSRFQHYLSSWRFYGGFDVSAKAVLRDPVPVDPSPVLDESGANLSAVLFNLMTEHVDEWLDLELYLRAVVPGFQSLTVKSRGGQGKVIAFWREAGIPGELTLADLSDGTLRFLCWAVLGISPRLPPLVCIDEPEIGLHPRALATLAGLLRLAARRGQVLIATHSPYFLAQFGLNEIAVMRQDDGQAVFRRPEDSAALRREVEEFGGGFLSQLHLSGELEARA
jgi:predicted ATPase